jgi:SAM-dependent methyltransferase
MFQKITRKQLELFLAKYATDKRTLDLGSGGSSYERFFPNRVTVDLDPLRKPDIVADAQSLPFKDGEFEVVLCTEMLEHVVNPFKVEAELRRVLSPGGMLILSTRFVYPLHDTPHDYWRYTKYGLSKLFEAWEIIELKPETETFSAIGALLQRVSFQSRLRFNKLLKFFALLLAWAFDRLNWLIIEEYGDIRKSRREVQIMATGYYLAAKRK